MSEVKEYYSNMKIHSDIWELRNIAIVASLTVQCALKRKNSVGIHFSIDYPTIQNQSLNLSPDEINQKTYQKLDDTILIQGIV